MVRGSGTPSTPNGPGVPPLKFFVQAKIIFFLKKDTPKAYGPGVPPPRSGNGPGVPPQPGPLDHLKKKLVLKYEFGMKIWQNF